MNALAFLAVIAPAVPARGGAAAELDLARVARHLDGDGEAFGEIYRGHAAPVYQRLTRILGPIPEREDLMQDVFLAVHRALPRFRGDAALGTLIQRIAINVAYEHLRRARRRPAAATDGAFFDELVAPIASPEARAEAREGLVRVFECLAKIKPKKRVALLLRVVDGMSFDEIGKLVDATPETVAKRVQAGQRELDAMLAKRGRA